MGIEVNSFNFFDTFQIRIEIHGKIYEGHL